MMDILGIVILAILLVVLGVMGGVVTGMDMNFPDRKK
jgi:hypothetical protein